MTSGFSDVFSIFDQQKSCTKKKGANTVDGGNPAPPRMYKTL